MDLSRNTKSELIEEIKALQTRIAQLENQTGQQKEFAKSFHESEENYKLFYQKSPLGYQSLDSDGKILDVNPAWLEIFGYTLEEVVGKWFGDFLAPDYVEHFKMNFPKFKKEGQIRGVNFEMITKNGDRIFVEFDGNIDNDKSGNFKKTHCVMKNISEKRKFELELRENHDRYIKAQELAKVGNWEYNIQTNVFWGSDEARKIYGFSPDSDNFSTDEIENCIPERERVHQALVDLVEQNKKYDLVFDIIKADGSGKRTIHSVAELQKDESGNPLKITGVIQDITERKLAEEKIKENEAHFQSLIRTIPDMIWMKDPEGIFITCNPKFERLFGVPLSEIRGKRDHDFFDKELADFFRQKDQEAIKAGKSLINEEEVVFADDGHFEIIETIKTPMYDSEGNLIGVLGIARDITERKQLEESLRESESKYRGLLDNLDAGVVAHAPDTTILYNNERALELLGLSQDQMTGKSAVDPQWNFLNEDGTVMAVEDYPVSRALKGNSKFDGYVIGILRPNIKNITWVICNSFLVSNEDGGLEHVVITFFDITERKQSEEQRKHSEEELKKVQQITHIGSWYLDIATNQVVWTEELYKMYGFDPTLPPPPYTEHMKLFAPESWELLSNSLENTQKTGTPYELELRTVKKDGTNGWMWVRGEVILDNNGKITGLWGAAQDITDRKLTEEALRESEIRFKALHNASFGGIAIHDKGEILECNKGLTEITGYSYEELIGMDGLLLIADGSREKVMGNILAEYGKPYEAIGQRKNGEKYPLRLEGRMIPYKGKKVRVVEFRDITEQKHAEEKIVIERNKAQQYLDIADVMLVGIDSSGEVTLINHKGSEVLGYSEEEILGQNWFDKFLPERMRETVKEVAKKVNSGEMESVKYYENEIITKSGKEKIIAWHNSILKDDEGNIIGTLSSGEDITERKKNEEELYKYRENLEELVKERTKELEEKNAELETYNKLFVGREFRIKELKDKIKDLENKLNAKSNNN